MQREERATEQRFGLPIVRAVNCQEIVKIERERRVLERGLSVAAKRGQIDIAPGGIVRDLMEKKVDLIFGSVAPPSCPCTWSGARQVIVGTFANCGSALL